MVFAERHIHHSHPSHQPEPHDVIIPPMHLTPSQAIASQTEKCVCIEVPHSADGWYSVALEDSLGRICGVMITTYPPGIPLIVPGERITPSLLQKLTQLRQEGMNIVGLEDTPLQMIEVIC